MAADDGTLLAAERLELSGDCLAQARALDAGIETLLAATELYDITYLSDGLKVKGYMALPAAGQRLPCLIYNRGGSRSFGALTPASAAVRLCRYASWGYAVVGSQYRGNEGGEGREEFGGADISDVLNLIPLLEGLPRADPQRIGIMGRSRGGMMTYLALARSDRFAAAVVDAGAADLLSQAGYRPEMEAHVYSELIPNFAAEREPALRSRSAVYWADRLHKQTPLLLLHGSADWRVHPTEALDMAGALFRCHHPFRFVLFEGGDHALSEHRAEVWRITRDWLDHYVRDRQPWPSLDPHGD